MENEIELIKGCRAGQDSARKELYTLYAKQMLAVCYRYTGDMDAAHDVLHDGFIKIFTRFTFRGECALGTWVTRVMVTQAIDYLRRKHRFSQLVVNEEQLPDVDAGLFELDAEKTLWTMLQAADVDVKALYEKGAYTDVLKRLAPMKAAVDQFFEDVMVNVDNVQIRLNRLALLDRLHRTMNKVAELSRLAK